MSICPIALNHSMVWQGLVSELERPVARMTVRNRKEKATAAKLVAYLHALTWKSTGRGLLSSLIAHRESLGHRNCL